MMFAIEYAGGGDFYDVYRDSEYVGQIERGISTRSDGKDYWAKSASGVMLGGAPTFPAALQIIADTLAICTFVDSED